MRDALTLRTRPIGILLLLLIGLGPSFGYAQVVKKVCPRIEGVNVPCGGGGGGCGCPTINSCTKPTETITCTSNWDGSTYTRECATCCFADQCDLVKDQMTCVEAKYICGQSCVGTKPRENCSGSCYTYKKSTYTRAIVETTDECLEEREREEFSCKASASTDGCTCSCSKNSSTGTCDARQTGICETPCSCSKQGQGTVVTCVKYKSVCKSVETYDCRTVDEVFKRIPGDNCQCVCPPGMPTTPPEILELPGCRSSTSCTPGTCMNC